MTHEEFAKTLTRFAQAMSRGDYGEAIALRSMLVLDNKALNALKLAAEDLPLWLLEQDDTPEEAYRAVQAFRASLSQPTLREPGGGAGTMADARHEAPEASGSPSAASRVSLSQASTDK